MANRLYTIVLPEQIGDRLETVARWNGFHSTTDYATEILVHALNERELMMQAGMYRRLQSEMREFFDLASDRNGRSGDRGRDFDDSIPF